MPFSRSLNIAASAVLLLGTALALPSMSTLVERKEANILAPTTIGIYLCTDAGWAGTCQHLVNSTATCISLPSSLAGQVSAVGPDAPASGCTLFQESDCSGEHLAGITNPGIANLTAGPEGGIYNDFFNSFICY